MRNKRGQDLSIGTLILIVLGIIVLVLLILGFSLGWQNLWDKINIFQGGSNIEAIISSCNIAVSSNAKYTYCSDFKRTKIGDETKYINCEYSAIANSLTSKLDCAGENANKATACKSTLGITGDVDITNGECKAVASP